MVAPERWARVRALLEKVVDLPLAERHSYVADACRDAPDVREEVESLLAAHEAAGTFLEPRPSPSDVRVAPLDRTPLAKGTRPRLFRSGLDARCWWHGRGVPRSRRAARPRCRDQSAPRRVCRRSWLPRTLRTRSAGDLEVVASAHLRTPRHRQRAARATRRAAVSRDGVTGR